MLSTDSPRSPYQGSNVLVDSCDDADTDDSDAEARSWWLAPEGATGDAAEIVLELACETTVDRVILANSANGKMQDRSEKSAAA